MTEHIINCRKRNAASMAARCTDENERNAASMATRRTNLAYRMQEKERNAQAMVTSCTYPA